MAKEKEEVKEEPVEAKREVKSSYKLVNVATQTANVIQNVNTEEILSLEQALVLVLNKLEKIERLLG